MIDGLKIHMPAAELAMRLAERADWNDATAENYDRQRQKPVADRVHPSVSDDMLQHEAAEHRGRAATLRLLRDHLVPGETYLLGERDLQFADLVPEFSLDMSMAPEYLVNAGDGEGGD